MSSRKTARWLDLIAFLLTHRMPVTREQIFEHVRGYLPPGEAERESAAAADAARRAFERDKSALRALGIEIETLPIPGTAGDEPNAGYLLRSRDFYLPYLELRGARDRGAKPYRELRTLEVSRADLQLLDRATARLAARSEFPLAAAARSARRKLEFDLPLPQADVERVLATPLSGSAAQSLAVLQRAVANRTAVTCRYYAIGRDAEETREIEPYGLFFSWGRWYCVARARDRDALRVFRVDRMREARAVRGSKARFDVPQDFSVRAYVGRPPWQLSNAAPTVVRVRFAFPESRWVQARAVGEAVEPLLDDGGAVLDFVVNDRHPFLRWLLTFRKQAEVVEPGEVRAELDALLNQVAALYA